MSNWTLLSNHGHVLVCLSRDPGARLRDVARDVGITERAVQKIVRDLQDGGMISVTKSGRRNCYRIHKKQTLRHELEADCTIKDLIRVINRQPDTKATDERPAGQAGAEAGTGAEKGARDSGDKQNAEPEPSPVIPEPVKPAAAKKTGKKESEQSNGFEKQQGTLF